MAPKRARRLAPRSAASAIRVPLWGAFSLIVAASLLLYSGSYRNPLLFDDRIISPPSLESFLVYWRTLEMRWLSYGSFGLNYLASGMDVFSYRVVNVLLHALLVISLYRFILRFAAAAGMALREPGLAALCAVVLFALHPVAVYDVAYLAQRTSLMAALFCVLSLHALLTGLLRDDARWLWGAVLLYFAAVSCKEHAIMLPAVALALALALRRPDWALVRRLAAPLVGFAFIGVLVVLKMKDLLGVTYEPFATVIGGGASNPG